MPWLRGVAVEAESPSTEIVNVDLRTSEAHSDIGGKVNHFTIEANPEVQELVVGVSAAAGRSGHGTVSGVAVADEEIRRGQTNVGEQGIVVG